MIAALRSSVQGLGRHTLRAAVYHAVFVAAVTVLKSATNALYLAHQSANGLPMLYMLVSAGMVVLTLLLAGPLARRPPRWQLSRASWTFAVLVALLCGLHALGQRWALGLLYITGELYGTCLSILFWSTVSTWFDVRTARKAFGVLSAGAMAGALVGGAATRFLAAAMGASASAVLVTVGAALTVGLVDGRGGNPVKAASMSMLAGARYLVERKYPRLLAILAVLVSALGACVDFVFRQASAHRLTELELATLFGDLNAAVGLVALIWQLTITGRLMERGGVFVYVAVIPTVMVLLGTASALYGAFPLLVVLKGVEMAGSFSIMQAGVQLLYNPLPMELRGAVRAFIDGVVKKSGMAMAGLGLAVAVSVFPAAASPWLVVVVAVAMLVLLRSLRGSYLAALEEKLRGGRMQVVASVAVEDKATRGALLQMLGSQRGADVLAALAILRRDDRFRPAQFLESLITHEDEAVRVAAMALVPTTPPPELEFMLVSILSTDARRPRAAAARALARVVPARAAQALLPHLDDADPGVSCVVIGALLAHPETRATAEARLSQLRDGLASRTPAWRREVARLMAQPDVPGAELGLTRLLHDPEPSVRALALESGGEVLARAVAAGDAPPPDLMREVRARLENREDRPAARRALVRLGDAVVSQLRHDLDDYRLPLRVRLEIPRLLQMVGTANAAGALLFSNINDHPSVRYRIANALFGLCRDHPDLVMDTQRVHAAARRRLEAFVLYRPLCLSLKAVHEGAPPPPQAQAAWRVLRRVTADRLVQNLEMALKLLGLKHGMERMTRAAERLTAAERARLMGTAPVEAATAKADALEVVDVALMADPLHSTVMAALEGAPAPARSQPPDVAQVCRLLAQNPDPLVSAFARSVLSAVGDSTGPGRSGTGPWVADPTDATESEQMDERTLSRIMALEKVDLFEGLTVDDLAAIASIAEERSAQAGQVLYREGEPGDTMMVITSGTVSLSHAGHHVMDNGPGESIGQVSFLDKGPRPTTAVVKPDSGSAELLCLRNDAFMDLVLDRPELNRGLFMVLARRLRALLDLPVQAGGKSS